MALGTSNDSTLTTPIETMVARCIADQGETESSDAECNPVREKNKKRTYLEIPNNSKQRKAAVSSTTAKRMAMLVAWNGDDEW